MTQLTQLNCAWYAQSGTKEFIPPICSDNRVNQPHLLPESLWKLRLSFMGKPVLHLKTPFAVEGLLPRCLGVEAYNGLLLDKWFVAASTNRFCFKMLQPGVEGFALPSQQRPLTDPRQILRNVRVGLAWTRISFWIEHGCSESGLSASELAYAMQGAIVWRLFWSSSTYTKFCQAADEIPHTEKNTGLHIHRSHIRVPHSTQQYSPGAVCRQPTASLLSRRRISNLLCKSFKIVGHAIANITSNSISRNSRSPGFFICSQHLREAGQTVFLLWT